MNKITNFSIAAIMNSQSRSRCAEAVEDEEDELEAKRRKLAEAVPALGESKINVIHWESYIIIKELEKKNPFHWDSSNCNYIPISRIKFFFSI